MGRFWTTQGARAQARGMGFRLRHDHSRSASTAYAAPAAKPSKHHVDPRQHHHDRPPTRATRTSSATRPWWSTRSAPVRVVDVGWSGRQWQAIDAVVAAALAIVAPLSDDTPTAGAAWGLSCPELSLRAPARGMESRARRRPAGKVRGPGRRCDAGSTLDGARAGAEPPVHPTPPVARSTGRSTPHRRSGAGVTVAASGAALRAGDGRGECPGRGRRSGGVASLDCVEGSLSAGE